MASGLGRGICYVLVFSEGGAAMTPDERQALREKHSLHPWEEQNICDYCMFEEDGMFDGQPYPCDAIRLLDELEKWVKE